jgi:5-methylcytosine-specific restriction endonuclease McrA
VILKNNFTEEIRNSFLYDYSCEDCSRSDRGLELHHIKGRTSTSILNAILICTPCHKKCCHSFEEERKYLQIAMRRELKRGYEMTEDDKEFVFLNKKYYN